MSNISPFIKDIQKQLFDMLVYVDNFCQKHGITYYLAGGTLLGAVRNGGFIPWDDDIDLMMDRQNYDNFIQAAISDLDKRFFLQCTENDPNWHYHYTKIRKNHTVYATEFSSKFINLHQGLFIDIFVQDKTSDTPKRAQFHTDKIILYRNLVRYLWHQEAHCEYIPRKKVLLLSKIYTLKRAQKKLKRIMLKYQNSNNKMMLDSSGMHLKNGAYPMHYLGKPVYIAFEGLRVPIPEHYNDYLIYLYGKDYMIPTQYSHTIKDIKL